MNSADAAWCELSNNLTVADILITGEIDTSRFDLLAAIQGVYIYKAWITYSIGEQEIQTGDVTFLH